MNHINSSDFLKKLSYVWKAGSKDYKLSWFYMKLFKNDNAEGSAWGRQYEKLRKTLTDQYLRLPSMYFNITGF